MQTNLEILKAGGIVLIPTDTIYGLAVDATNAEAVSVEIVPILERPTLTSNGDTVWRECFCYAGDAIF